MRRRASERTAAAVGVVAAAVAAGAAASPKPLTVTRSGCSCDGYYCCYRCLCDCCCRSTQLTNSLIPPSSLQFTRDWMGSSRTEQQALGQRGQSGTRLARPATTYQAGSSPTWCSLERPTAPHLNSPLWPSVITACMWTWRWRLSAARGGPGRNYQSRAKARPAPPRRRLLWSVGMVVIEDRTRLRPL